MSGVRRSCRIGGLLGLAGVILLSVTSCTDGGVAPAASTRSGPGTPRTAHDPSPPPAFPSLAASPGPALATANGRLAGLQPDSVARLDVIAVQAGASGTVLSFRLSTAAPGTLAANRQNLSGTARIDGVGGVSLVAPQVRTKFSVVRLAEGGLCACSSLPKAFSPEPAALYAEFPPIPPQVSDVQVVVPGFDPVTVALGRV